MSVRPRTTLYKDPAAVLTYLFDWSDWLGATAQIATSTFTISGPDSALTKDNPSLVSGNLKSQVRLTGGTVGLTYVLTNQIVTNETPTQTDERSVNIKIQNQ